MAERKEITMGGQALIEGVMMKAGKKIAMVARKPDGTLVKDRFTLRRYRFRWMGWPFFRGVFNLIEMLFIGMKGLIWSANQHADEEDEELSKGELVFLVISSVSFAVLFFVALPYILTDLVGFSEALNPIWFNIVDGTLKILIFITYILIISTMHDVKRLFEYHGAEHMAVYCYEAKKELTIENVRKYSTCHPRCGTAFIMIVFVVSIFVFSAIPLILIRNFPDILAINPWLQKLILFPIRIIFIMPIAGISYEMLRLSARFSNNFLARAFIYPGILLQKLTTKQPDDKQIEVAISSLKHVIE